MAANDCASFLPAGADGGAKILILGSMPGAESLRQRRYYAFARNAFWPILGDFLGFDPGMDYPLRVKELERSGIALWDVLKSCRRTGSLDADISRPEPNALDDWLHDHPDCRRIFCNGGAAARYFRRFFPRCRTPVTQLPSTSPAAARWSFDEKRRIWENALRASFLPDET